MAEYEINVDRFWSRLALLHGHWLRYNNGWNGSDIILILCGKSDDAGYKRNNSIHIWLFGYELLSTIILITKNDIYICCGSKTSQTLKQLQTKTKESKEINIKINLITKNKQDGYKQNFLDLMKIISSNNTKKIGLINEEIKGFAEKFDNYLKTNYVNNKKYEIVSFGEALSDIMMVKDKFELKTMKNVSELTSLSLKYFQKQMEKLIEKGRTKTHNELSSDLLKILENPKIVKSKLKNENLDVCYDPIIQSGGKYKLKPSAESNNDNLHYEYGTIIIMMGFRLRDYCSNISRTFLIDASKQQKEIYNILVTVFKKGLLMLRDNVELNKIYEKCISTIKKSKQPQLEKHFLKSCGWGIGLEFRDKNYIIKKNNKKLCKAGMIFNFQVGFENLIDKKKEKRNLEKAKKYSIIIGDTVLVTDDQPEFLTKFNRKLLEYELNGDMDDDKMNNNKNKEKEKKEREKKKNNKNEDASYLPPENEPYRRVTRQSNRKSAQEQKEQLAARRERSKKQRKLLQERTKRLETLLIECGGNLLNEKNENEWVDPKCFNDSSDLSSSIKQTKLYIDLNRECLICPIMDHCVPFHITTIKNFSISTTPDGTYLRINFICPSSESSSKSKQKSQPELYLKHRDSHFIKELTYKNNNKSGDNNLQFCFIKLKELQKQYKTNKKNKLLNRTMKKQDRLQRAISTKMLILKELSLKPSLGGRKRGTGRLETHQNGFKYIDHSRNEVHILFNNIKNAFFQKSKNTTAVIIHFHLKDPIMIGKKPSKHVQVYRDVIERFEELGRRRRYDYDGTRAEQEEQKRIKRTNQQFKLFCDKSQQFAKENGFLNLEFEKPAMDLVFNGVPNKQSTNIYPTESCLIALEDSPAFVIDTNDIEIAHFERVNYSLRNFDLVFVYKDFKKEPHRITTIPRENIDTLQDFLNWKNVLYSQGKINLDWKTLINRIRSNLKGFVESGGWDFLSGQQQEDDNDDGNNGNNNEPDEDEYVPDYNSDDYSDDYSDDDYSDDDDVDDDDFDDFESDEYSDNHRNDNNDDDDEQGLDWDELDRRAALEDKKAARKEAQDTRRSRINSRNQSYRSNHQMSNYNKRRRY